MAFEFDAPMWVTRRVFNVYDFLEPMRARTAMYTGEQSQSSLRSFLDGYVSALGDYGIPIEPIGICRPMSRERPYFHGWVTHRLGVGSSNLGYSQAILKHTNGDEVAALALFWVLLDEYRALEAEIDGA